MPNLTQDLRRAAVPFGQPTLTLDGVRRRAHRRGVRRRVAAVSTSIVVTVAAGALVIRSFAPREANRPMDGTPGQIAFLMDEDGRPPSVGVVGSGTISGVEPGPWAATWSPTGDAFVFTGSTGDGDLDLWISDPRGRDVRRLTQGIGADFSPRFDPTGDLVLFLRNVEGRPMATFTVDVTTGHTERVPVPDVPMEVTWGAGGRSVIAVTHSGREGDPNRLVQVSLVGRAPTILYRGSFNEPSASPDGAWIAISAEGRLVLVPTDGSGDQVLVEGLDLDGLSQLSWSPDGAHLLFTDPVDPVAGERLRVVEVASGTSEVVADTLAWRGSAPAWSPDSRWIAFERAGDIWAVDIRTHQLSRMTETDGLEAYPSWGSG